MMGNIKNLRIKKGVKLKFTAICLILFLISNCKYKSEVICTTNASIKCKGTTSKEGKTGLWVYFNQEGSTVLSGNYCKNKMCGLWTFHESETITVKIHYFDGLPNGKYIYNDVVNSKKIIGQVKDGVLNDIWTTYLANADSIVENFNINPTEVTFIERIEIDKIVKDCKCK